MRRLLTDALGNTAFLIVLFVLSFPILGPFLLWLLKGFFGLFHLLDELAARM